MRIQIVLFVASLALASCHPIKSGNSLSASEVTRIQKLGLLEPGETILRFYSEFKTSVAGNFYTDKRLAKYWIDGKDREKDEVSTAFYPEIRKIDTVYTAGATYAPYLLVTKTDGSAFKVYANGSKAETRAFFEGALAQWAQHKNAE